MAGFGVLLSILSGLNGIRLLLAHPARMFFLVNACFLAGLYKQVKCPLLMVFTPPRSSRSTWS
jgi:hypothetical protein